MRVLVLGATGETGKEVVRWLLAEKADRVEKVVILGRRKLDGMDGDERVRRRGMLIYTVFHCFLPVAAPAIPAVAATVAATVVAAAVAATVVATKICFSCCCCY